MCACMYVSMYACRYIRISLVVARNKMQQRELDASANATTGKAKFVQKVFDPNISLLRVLKSKFAPHLLLYPIAALVFSMS